MTLRAGFAEADITPPVGIEIIGWLCHVVAKRVLDPICARAAVFEADGRGIGFIQLDTLSVRWKTVEAIRCAISERYGFPGQNVMVAATHNHAGPAIVRCGEVPRDDRYLQEMTEAVVALFGTALDGLQEAEIGTGSCFDFDLSYNRRVVMRDGTVRCQEPFTNPNALYVEGPTDPEVAVLAARSPRGELLGCVANFACHPTHHGGEGVLSAGFPGVFAKEMRARGCPVALFLNGAAGNLIVFDARHGNRGLDKEGAGLRLADDVSSVLKGLTYRASARLDSAATTVSLPFRDITPEEIAGTVRGAQRFVNPALYDWEIPGVVERIRARGSETAQVQVHCIDDWGWASIPAEYFVEFGLEIKERAFPRHALVVAYANGMLGYVPHPAAFPRGGYETTFMGSSRMGTAAGGILADAAVDLLRTVGS